MDQIIAFARDRSLLQPGKKLQALLFLKDRNSNVSVYFQGEN